MAFCKTVNFLYAALPARSLRNWLIRAHMEKCPVCQARLVSAEEARGLLIAKDQVGDPRSLWRRLAAEAGRPAGLPAAPPAPAGAAWRRAAAAVLALAIALTGFWLLREIERSGLGPGAIARTGRFELSYVLVGGAPAQTFVFQPQGSDTVFVWAQKTP